MNRRARLRLHWDIIWFQLKGVYRAIFEDWGISMKKLVSGIFGLACVAFLSYIWWDKPHRELAWFMLPVGGLFRQIGGTWYKAVGRFLTPALPALALGFFVGWSWWCLLVYGAYLLIKTAPVTLGGDSVTKNILSYAWVWILGALNGLVCLSMAVPMKLITVGLLASIVPMVAYGVCITLSNLKFSRDWVVWKFCEFMMGMTALYPACQLIEQYRTVVTP